MENEESLCVCVDANVDVDVDVGCGMWVLVVRGRRGSGVKFGGLINCTERGGGYVSLFDILRGKGV